MCSFSIFLFAFCFFASFASAETNIYGGVISQDTTLTKDASPYIIYAPQEEGDSPFTIASGTTLTIDSGVIVKFDYGQSINVLGKLIANGASDEKVYFTSIDDSIGKNVVPCDNTLGEDADLCEDPIEPYNDDWAGIEIASGGNTELNNSVISYAETALYAESATGLLYNIDIKNCVDGIVLSESTIDIKNSNIKDLDGDGMIIVYNSVLSIENSDIENISGDALFLYSNSTSSIKSSTINNVGGDGFNINHNGTLNIQDSNIKNISGWIFDIFGKSIVDIKNSNIEDSSGGIEVFNDSILNINNSQITDVAGRPFLNIFNNSTSNIVNSQVKNVTSRESTLEVFNGSHLDFLNSSLQNISGIAIEAFGNERSGYATTTLNISSSTISDGDDIGLQISGNKTETNISKTKIKNFASDGIQTFSDPNVTITDSDISGNNNGIENWGANIEVKNSAIKNNISYGIYNESSYFRDDILIEKLPIKAINNWWGDASGPFNLDTNASGTANQVSENVEYEPWLISEPGTKPKCCSNVLFIPGLEASRLYKTDNDGGEKRLWEPGLFHDNSELYLDTNGEPKNPGIYTKDIIDNAYLPIKGNIYKSFISSMDKMKSDKVINDWNAVPYDWRLSIDEILDGGQENSDGKIYYSGDQSSTSNPYIISELRRLASSSATGKVTVIAHSNGGLITKELTNKLGDEAPALIDQIIFVAVPEAGTPSAIGALLHGFQTGLPKDWFPLFISPSESRTLGNNMSSAYNLLPSSQYFNYVSDPVITFDNSDLLAGWREKYGSEINTGDGLYNFLSDQSREVLPTIDDLVSPPILNKNLSDSAKEIHDTQLDSWTPPSGVSLTEIAGWGEDTLSGIEYYQGISTKCGNQNDFSTCSTNFKAPILEYNPKITSDGDGTVVVPSALWTATSSSVEKYWVDLMHYDTLITLQRKHADILEVPELRSLIKNIITQSSSTLPEYISTSSLLTKDLTKKLHFILHSPLSLDLYDDLGNHTGISTTTNELEENIPGSDYEVFGEVKYISIPASSTVYLSMQGYSSGSFTLNIEEAQGDTIIASTTFAGVPSSTSTIVTINISNGNISSTSPLIVDVNGDGKQDITILPRLGEVVVPDFPKKQSNSARRRNISSVIDTTNSSTNISVFESEVKNGGLVLKSDPSQMKVNLTGQAGKGESSVFIEPYSSATTTSISVTSNKTLSKNKIIEPKNGGLSLRRSETTGKGGSSVFNKNLTTPKFSNNNESLLATVGNILVGNDIIHQIISTTISFIKNIINKISLWYN